MNDEGVSEAHRVLATRGECLDAIRATLADAARVGCRELWLCDVDYADWPLGEREVIESLTRWAYGHRRLTLFAAGFETLSQRHPRWLEWRRRWSHVVECRALEETEPGRVPSLLLAPGVATLRIFDTVHWRGSVSAAEADAIRCRETVDALMQRSVESFPATALGL
jgi:hypothetical protein